MVKRSIPVAIILVSLIGQGCLSQVVGERIQKGPLVKEDGTGSFSAVSRKDRLELISPLTVRIYEDVERTETTNRYYQKIMVRQQAKAKKYPVFDTWIKVLLSTAVVPLFFPSYWVEGSYVGTDCLKEPLKCTIRNVPSPVRGEFFVEKGSRSIVERRNGGGDETVGLYINGYYKGELPVDESGAATAELLKYPDLVGTRKPVKLTFKFRRAYAYSTLRQDEIKKIFENAGSAADVRGSTLSR